MGRLKKPKEHRKYRVPSRNCESDYLQPIMATGFAFRLKSVRTSAARLPQAVQTKRGSMSIDQDAAHACRAHLRKGDLLRAGELGHGP